jgi:hypothetical protein
LMLNVMIVNYVFDLDVFTVHFFTYIVWMYQKQPVIM